jgi:effector-binding domain-containing protein
MYLVVPAAMLCVMAVEISGKVFPQHQTWNLAASALKLDTVVPVTINMELTKSTDLQVLYIRDTAATTDAIGKTLGTDYGELMRFFQRNKLRPNRFMAWYITMGPPWVMDAGVETDRIPESLEGRIQSRVIAAGDVLVAHMWGPYDQVGKAYTRIQDWLRDNKRSAKSGPYEVYLNDPASVKSPAELRTDICQPLQ